MRANFLKRGVFCIRSLMRRRITTALHRNVSSDWLSYRVSASGERDRYAAQ